MESKPILITGCSSGIGEATALLLKQRGYRVFATARKTADVERLNKQGFESLPLDVNDSASIERALARVLQLTGGKLYALFNNAGYVQAGAVDDLTREMERSQFETNVFGPMELVRRVLAPMRAQGYGRIIQNSSIMGVITLPYYGAYSASKFALEGFSRTLRLELLGTNIHVSIINPGPIHTKIRDNAYLHYQDTLQHHHENSVHKEVYDRMEKNYFSKDRKEDRLTLGPNAVAKQVLSALESAHPKVHYYTGFPARTLAFLQRILPDKAMDWVLAKIK